MKSLTRRPVVSLALALILGGCSGQSPTGSTTLARPQGTGEATLRATATRIGSTEPSPAPSASPAAPITGDDAIPASCPLGYGVVDPPCTHQDPQLLSLVEAAQDAVVATQPAIFDLTAELDPGSYKVRDQGALERAVVDDLVGHGVCAQVRDGNLQVKNANQFSETYTLVQTSGYLWRGPGKYRSTCTPAAFPVNPTEAIVRIRIAFYEMKCGPGAAERPPSPTMIYAGCRGTVTASPKDAHDDDVPADIHGPDILWEIESGEQYLLVQDYPDVAFNKYLQGLDPGEFRICATVQGVRSCMNGQVL